MKKLFVFLFVLSAITFGQINQVNGFGILSGTVTAASATITGGYVYLGNYNNVSLAVEADSTVTLAITIYDGSTSNHVGTVAAASADTMTVTIGGFGAITLKGYNSSGTYTNRISGANYIKVAAVRQTSSTTVSAKVNVRLILKN